MENIIGREKEIKRLNKALEEDEAQLIIVYGRRRVGKTFLINEFFDYKFDFKFTGAYNQTKKIQLNNFILELNRYAKEKYNTPKNWTEAFYSLRDYLERGTTKEKQVVFFDEMPWMDNQKSGFLEAFEWFWNSWGSSRKNLVFVVCGSATSWLRDNIDRNKGGLFNRRTCRLYLEPFNLYDVERYLLSRNINWSRYDITQCYMIMGGIPFYLKLLDRNLTLNENIDEIFFKKRGELWDEFDQLYRTLFSNSDKYIRIIEILSTKRKGCTWGEIARRASMPANGVLTKMLTNLVESGFVRLNEVFGHIKREQTYQLSDYYTVFYFRYLKDHSGKDENLWSRTYENRSREVWEGLTFEQVCKDHLIQIKRKLGISAVSADVSSWYKQGGNGEDGAQIDLLFDRKDKTINLCEIKFYSQEFEIKKDYDESLKTKVRVFREATGTNKTIQLNMITTYGIKQNKYSNSIGRVVKMDDLFAKSEE